MLLDQYCSSVVHHCDFGLTKEILVIVRYFISHETKLSSINGSFSFIRLVKFSFYLFDFVLSSCISLLNHKVS